MKSLFSKMFSISGEESRSFTFCVAPVGTPPHFRNRFQISQEKAAVCSSRKSKWNSSQKYHVALPWLRLVFDVDVGAVVKHVQAAVHIQIKGLCHPVGLRDMLRHKRRVQIRKDRHIFRAGVCQIGPVDHLHRPVNHRLFDGFQPARSCRP